MKLDSNGVLPTRRILKLTIHSTDTSIANSTMVRIGWLVGLAVTAHSMCHNALLEQDCQRNSFGGHRARIRSHRLYMTGQGQGANRTVNHCNAIGDATRIGQECDCHHTVTNQYPDHTTHDRPHFIAQIDPNSVMVASPKGALPRFVVKGIFIVFCRLIRGRFGTNKFANIGTASSAKAPTIRLPRPVFVLRNVCSASRSMLW